MSKFNIFTIDLHVILSIIVATDVNAVLLKFLQKNSPHIVQAKGGGGNGFLNNVKKNCTFLARRLPLALDSLRPLKIQKLFLRGRGVVKMTK